MKKIELLSPAGDFEKMKYAFAYGADAVYAGVPRFSLRARENDFRDHSLQEAVEYAHGLNKKIYLTLNIFPHNTKINAFIKALKWMNEIKPDALILSDPGVIMLARENCADIPIHLSTQANTVNWASVKFWQQQGVQRIILSRELSLKEIREIRTNVPDIELEAFVHGAICIAYSGRCLLSNYFNHRDPNQGTCTNSCRWEYKVYEEQPYTQIDGEYYLEQTDRPGEMMPVDEDEHGTYIMNSKDLCAIGLLDEMRNAGIDSFKIEGRTKSVYYLSVITRAYRQALDAVSKGEQPAPEIINEVYSVANRGYITGFLKKNPRAEGENFLESHSTNQNHEFCGIVKEYDQAQKRAKIAVRNRIEKGDKLQIFHQHGISDQVLTEIFDTDGLPRDVAHGGGEDVWINISNDPGEFALVRKYTEPGSIEK